MNNTLKRVGRGGYSLKNPPHESDIYVAEGIEDAKLYWRLSQRPLVYRSDIAGGKRTKLEAWKEQMRTQWDRFSKSYGGVGGFPAPLD